MRLLITTEILAAVGLIMKCLISSSEMLAVPHLCSLSVQSHDTLLLPVHCFCCQFLHFVKSADEVSMLFNFSSVFFLQNKLF